MNRYAPEGDWRTNVALGGAVEDMSEQPERGGRDRQAVDRGRRP